MRYEQEVGTEIASGEGKGYPTHWLCNQPLLLEWGQDSVYILALYVLWQLERLQFFPTF